MPLFRLTTQVFYQSQGCNDSLNSLSWNNNEVNDRWYDKERYDISELPRTFWLVSGTAKPMFYWTVLDTLMHTPTFIASRLIPYAQRNFLQRIKYVFRALQRKALLPWWLLEWLIYTVRLCRIRQAYDRPMTWIVSCKSNLQLAYDCRLGPT